MGDTGDVAQRVHISSCFLMDAAIGNSNRMSVSLGAAGPAGGAGPGDGNGDPGELAEDTGEPGPPWPSLSLSVHLFSSHPRMSRLPGSGREGGVTAHELLEGVGSQLPGPSDLTHH